MPNHVDTIAAYASIRGGPAMTVDIQINISFPSPDHLSASWTDGASRPSSEQQPGDQDAATPEVRVIPIGTSVLAPGLVTPFGV
jgi:hypothetical protein